MTLLGEYVRSRSLSVPIVLESMLIGWNHREAPPAPTLKQGSKGQRLEQGRPGAFQCRACLRLGRIYLRLRIQARQATPNATIDTMRAITCKLIPLLLSLGLSSHRLSGDCRCLSPWA